MRSTRLNLYTDRYEKAICIQAPVVFKTDFNKEQRVASSRLTNSESSQRKSAHDYGWKSNYSFSVQAGSFKAISSTASCLTTVSFMLMELEKLLEKAGANLPF